MVPIASFSRIALSEYRPKCKTCMGKAAKPEASFITHQLSHLLALRHPTLQRTMVGCDATMPTLNGYPILGLPRRHA